MKPLFGGFRIAVYCAVGAIRGVMAADGVRQPPMAGKWRTSGTQSLVSRRIPARYAALCIPGYGRVPSLCDERVQTEGGADLYNRSSAVDANGLMSRGRRANPVLTYTTALRRFSSTQHLSTTALRRFSLGIACFVGKNTYLCLEKELNDEL